jgi:hypothetical protein
MEAIRRLLTIPSKPPSPPHVESDDVYPVHMLDDTATLRSIVITWTLCFNDVLDADKLHASLSKLLNIGDWGKIGGRLRLKVSFLINVSNVDPAYILILSRRTDSSRSMFHDLSRQNVLL